MKEKIKKIFTLSICLLISMSFVTGNALAEFENKVTGELIISSNIRYCPFTHCQVEQTLEKGTKVIILGINRQNENMEWYVVIGEGGLPGSIHYSLLTQDYRDIFLNNEVTSFILTGNENELLRTCPSFDCNPYDIYRSVDYGLIEIKESSGEWYKAQLIKEIEVITFNYEPWGDTIVLEDPVIDEVWIHKDAVPEDIKENFAAFYQINTEEGQTFSSKEFIGTLAMPGTLRECSSTDCEIIRYYAETAEIKIVGLDDNNEWYQVKTHDDYGNELNGWMYYSLFTEDFRSFFISEDSRQEISSSNDKDKVSGEKEIVNKPNFLLSFFQNKSFQSSLIITFVSIVLLLSVLLLRKKIKVVLESKWSGINLQKIKSKRKSFVISTLIAIGIGIGIFGISYGAVYYQISKLLEEAEQLTKAEKYDEAIGKLELGLNRRTVKSLGIKKQEISNKIEEVKQLSVDKTEYNQGIEEFNKEDWGKAKELLSKVSDTSPYYQDAQNKIGEVQKKITEAQIVEAVGRTTGEIKSKAEEAQRAAEEAQRRIEEEKAKRIAAETQQRTEEKKSQEKTKELEQKIEALQQTQQFQVWSEFQASEIVEELGKYVVVVVCYDKFLDVISGSGIIYALGHEEQSIILTNYHITQDADLTLEYPCFVAYSSDPTKGFTDFYFAEPTYFPSAVSLSTMALIDFDFLSIIAKFRMPEYGKFEIIPNASLQITDLAPVICSDDKVRIGEEIVVLGYPTIGGEYLTATEGIISSYDSSYYLTTSAKIEAGSSGGGAFLKSTGCFMGMPTFVRLGEIESFARLINMPYLQQNYLSKIWPEKSDDSSDLVFCNAQYWSPCPTGHKFYCPPAGDPQCYPPDSIFCNNKYWNPCPFGYEFYCPSVGDPYCR